MHPVILVILDGFGLAPASETNAVHLAHTPNFDNYWQNYPHAQLQASGEAVGLPKGQMGNSEVGHLNIGAGRVVMQSLSYVQKQIDSEKIFENKVLNEVYEVGNSLHLMGLLSDGGVHSDINHLFGLLELAKRKNITETYLHIFTDGRDTAPNSSLGFIRSLESKIAELNINVQIATVSGRYYAMDRDNRWERIKQAYDAIVCGKAEFSAQNAEEAVQNAYKRNETDEFIKPTVISSNNRPIQTLNDGDAVFFFNFRADRARQLTYALMGDKNWLYFERCCVVKVHYASLMEYDKQLNLPYALQIPDVKMPLAKVLSAGGKTQYHTAETEKYPHVTYFFNAKLEEPVTGEERLLIPSPKVATYDLKPEMSAPELTETTLTRIREHNDDFILINYANPDMVGHTGIIPAAIKACETSDEGLGKLVEAMREKGGVAIIIADHGNAEQMADEDGNPHTAHTTNPVPCIIIGGNKDLKLRSGGVLGDVAPTVLELMKIPPPPEMTGKSLIQK